MAAKDDADTSRSSVLDLTAYQAHVLAIQEPHVAAVCTLPRFLGAVAAYRSAYIPLGYAAFFAWRDAEAAVPGLSLEYLMDLIRHVARRSHLDPSDHRHIAIDGDWAFAEFPNLYKRRDHTRLKAAHDEFMAEMNDFAPSHPWRESYHSTLESREAVEYAKYWLKASWERVRALLSDRRFSAGLDAYQQGQVSYAGFLENVYGDGNYTLFPEIGWNLSGLVLGQLAHAISRGELSLPEGLRDEYPRFYESYDPEAFGRRLK